MLIVSDFEMTLWCLAAMVTAILLKSNIYSQLKLSACWHAILDVPYIYQFLNSHIFDIILLFGSASVSLCLFIC